MIFFSRRMQDIFILLKNPIVSKVRKWECKSFSKRYDLGLDLLIVGFFDSFIIRAALFMLICLDLNFFPFNSVKHDSASSFL